MRLLIQGIDFDFRINVPEVVVTTSVVDNTDQSPAKKRKKKSSRKRQDWKDFHKIIFVGLLRSMCQSAAPVHIYPWILFVRKLLRNFQMYPKTFRRQTANRWEAHVEKLEQEEREEISRNLSAATLAAAAEKKALSKGTTAEED